MQRLLAACVVEHADDGHIVDRGFDLLRVAAYPVGLHADRQGGFRCRPAAPAGGLRRLGAAG